MTKKLAAEFFGTFWLIFCGCGVAVLGHAPDAVIALAFGLALFTMSAAVGGISGGHFNPAVTFGLVVAGRVGWLELVPYWLAQTLGGIAGAWLLHLIAAATGGFGANGYGALSPGNYGLGAALILEIVVTAFFVLVYLGANAKFPSPLAVGFAYALIYLVSIPVTNGGANPARSTAAALFADNGAIHQLWAFWLGPLVGALLGALIWVRLIEIKEPAKTS